MSETKKLCIVPCGSAKIWDKTPQAGRQKAENVYTGVFAGTCQRYAKAFFDDWVILSAKHGFLFPDDIVGEPYNVSFIKPNSESVSLETLREQALQKGLFEFAEITVLGGKHYVERVNSIFNKGQTILLPLNDCKGIGYMLQRLTNALEGNAQMSNNINYPKKVKAVKVESDAPFTGKYTPLYEFLLIRQESFVKLSVDEIESLLGFPLPASASKHRAWWSNDLSHSHAKAWLFANYQVDQVSLPNISFIKNHDD